MKKVNLLLIGLILSTASASAENWVQLETGFYVDTDSVVKYYLPHSDNIYSVWTKSYNDGSNNFYPNEDYFNNLVLIDCDNAKSTLKTGKTYYKDGHVEQKVNITNNNLKWMNVNPLSKGEVAYAYVCQPHIKKQEYSSTSNSDNTAPSDIYKQKVKSMLYIEAPNSKGGSQGSGVILNSDGTFVTCFHVIAKADYIKVKTTNGEEYYVDGFKYINPLEDIAILTLNTNKNDFIPISLPYKSSQIGEKVYTISSPQGFEFSFSDGMISRFSQENIQFSAPSSPGSSGGALLNSKGDLLGIISWQRTDGQNINFATPNSYYTSQMYNKPIKNLRNEKWSRFVLNKASEEQYKLTIDYALKWEDFTLLYQYLRPYVALSDYPKDMYALAGYIAYNAYVIDEDNSILRDAISWYEKSLENNFYEELSSFALFTLYCINYDINKNKIERLIPYIVKYPKSQSLIMEVTYCQANDNKCYEDWGIKVFTHIYDLTSKIYWNNNTGVMK